MNCLWYIICALQFRHASAVSVIVEMHDTVEPLHEDHPENQAKGVLLLKKERSF